MNNDENDSNTADSSGDHRKMIIQEKLELLREILQDIKDHHHDRATIIKQAQMGVEILGRLSQVLNQ